MTTQRRVRLWQQVVETAAGATVTIDNVCAVAVTAVEVDSVAVAVTLAASPRETLHASDQFAADLEELALTLGEGPGIDALADGPALVADLSAVGARSRWPAFAPAAIAAGLGAMFAFPLRVGGVHIGVLDLYRRHPRELGRDQLADALILADTACALLLDSGQPEAAARQLERAVPHHPEVHQATGMVTVQLGVTASVALIRLRAHAYANDLRLRDVAADVVARRLRFDPDEDPR